MDQALDAYFQLRDMAESDPNTSPQVRQIMRMLDESLGSTSDLQGLLSELLGGQAATTHAGRPSQQGGPTPAASDR